MSVPGSLDSIESSNRWKRSAGRRRSPTGSFDSADDGSPIGPLYTAPTSIEGPGYEVSVPTVTIRRYVIITVGLPARGKTFLASKLSRYMAWQGHKSTVFNLRHSFLEAYRQRYPHGVDGAALLPPRAEETSSGLHHNNVSATRFQLECEEGQHLYRHVVDQFFPHIQQFFQEKGVVAIINDDFVTSASREYVEKKVSSLCDEVLYVEVLRDGSTNTLFESMKAADEREYGVERDTAAAREDFAKRLLYMQSVYESVQPPKHCIRICNAEKYEIFGVKGYLPSRMTSFLMNVSQLKTQYPIYFTRHGESEFNLDERLGGNPRLTPKGHIDAYSLKSFVQELIEIQEREKHPKPLQIWTSQLTRTIQTAAPAEHILNVQCLRHRNLNEIHAGICEGLTYAEVKEKYPLIHEFRKRNKYAFRYPEGESYQDLVTRLEPVILDLENADRAILVVAHQAVLRALLAYFGSASAEESVNVVVPHRTVWRCVYSVEGVPLLSETHLTETAPTEGVGSPLNEPEQTKSWSGDI